MKLKKYAWKGVVGVCGGAQISEKAYQDAYHLGLLLAQHQYAVVCGGLGGTMEAVAKGMREGGGFCIGIVPSYNKSDANPYVDLVIPSGLGEARNILVVSTADVVVTIAGGAGTLSEMAFAWKMNKPIIALSETGEWSEKLGGKKIDMTRSDHVYPATTPQDALDHIERFFGL